MKQDRTSIRLSISVKTLLTAVVFGALISPGMLQAQRTNLPEQFKSGTDVAINSQQSDDARERHITLTLRNTTLEKAMNEIAKSAGLKLTYSKTVVPVNKKVEVFSVTGMPVGQALNKLLEGTKLVAIVRANGQGVITSGQASQGLSGDGVERKVDNVVKGRVVDSASKSGIPGVLVVVVGTDIKTVTDKNGAFALSNVPANRNQLSFRLLGYVSAVRTIEDIEKGTNLIVALVPAATSLNEVVTTAVGSQRRVEVGNDIVKLSAPEILARAPARTVSDLLRYAQVPGVSVQTASGEPGAPTRIRMRGIGSISQNADPAVIVDGIWINSRMSDSSIINRAWGPGGISTKVAYTASPIDNIDPNNIETIEIVRGPSAASLYGQEAANGVIVITTKRGKPGPAAWTYSYSKDWDSQVRSNFGDWYGYGTLANGTTGNVSCTVARHYNLQCIQDSVINFNGFGNLLDETGPGSFYKHSLGVRGGTDVINYSFNGSYGENIGTRRTPGISLIRARLLNVPLSNDLMTPRGKKDVFLNSAIGFNANRNLSFDFTFSAANSKTIQNEVNFSRVSVKTDTVTILNATQVDIINGGMDELSAKSSISAALRPDTWWNSRAQLGIDVVEKRGYSRNDYRDCLLGICAPLVSSGSSFRLRNSSGSTKVLTGRASASGRLSTRFDRFIAMTPSIGMDIKRTLDKQLLLNMRDVPFGADQGNGEGIGEIASNDIITAGYSVSSAFNILNRLNFDIGFRQDAGSVIQMTSSSRYPKLQTAWLISDEGFFPKNNVLSGLKLRGSLGYAAVHPDAADLNGGYQYRRAIVNGESVWVADLTTVGNNKLVPEKSLELEGGLDAYLWDDRAVVIFSIANKSLKNAIVNRIIPISSGVEGLRKENISRVQNRSIELNISARAIDNDLMLLQITGNISNINNVIKRLGNRTLTTSNTSKNRLVEGYQIGAVWDRPILGYSDANGDGFLEANELILGDTTVYKGWNTPKFTAGYDVNISILNRNLTAGFSLAQTGARVQYVTYLDNYGSTVVGAPIELQALTIGNGVNNGMAMKVSDIRLATASISYNLPRSFAQRLKSKLVNVSLQGSNLGLWTSYSGRDPMVNSSPIGNAFSDDGYTLPMPRKYSFNVRMEL